jgi:hypothetical protein
MALFLSRRKPRSNDGSSSLGKKAYLSCSSSRTGPIYQELPSGTGRKTVKVRFLLQPHVSGIVMRTESTRLEHSAVDIYKKPAALVFRKRLVSLPRQKCLTRFSRGSYSTSGLGRELQMFFFESVSRFVQFFVFPF